MTTQGSSISFCWKGLRKFYLSTVMYIFLRRVCNCCSSGDMLESTFCFALCWKAFCTVYCDGLFVCRLTPPSGKSPIGWIVCALFSGLCSFILPVEYLFVRLSLFLREDWYVRLSLYGSALSWTFYFSPGVTVSSVTYAEQAVSRSDLL
jgi:hypothetical protein